MKGIDNIYINCIFIHIQINTIKKKALNMIVIKKNPFNYV